jgi:hypothetical protein
LRTRCDLFSLRPRPTSTELSQIYHKCKEKGKRIPVDQSLHIICPGKNLFCLVAEYDKVVFTVFAVAFIIIINAFILWNNEAVVHYT